MNLHFIDDKLLFLVFSQNFIHAINQHFLRQISLSKIGLKNAKNTSSPFLTLVPPNPGKMTLSPSFSVISMSCKTRQSNKFACFTFSKAPSLWMILWLEFMLIRSHQHTKKCHSKNGATTAKMKRNKFHMLQIFCTNLASRSNANYNAAIERFLCLFRNENTCCRLLHIFSSCHAFESVMHFLNK